MLPHWVISLPKVFCIWEFLFENVSWISEIFTYILIVKLFSVFLAQQKIFYLPWIVILLAATDRKSLLIYEHWFFTINQFNLSFEIGTCLMKHCMKLVFFLQHPTKHLFLIPLIIFIIQNRNFLT